MPNYRTRFFLFPLLVAGFRLAIATPALVAEEVSPVEVARLIRQLGNDDYTQREQADQQLANLGTAGEAQLRDAATSEAGEIRLRANDLLLRLQTAQIWAASPVDLHAEGQPLSAVLATLAEQTGSAVQIATTHDGAAEPTVKLDLRDTDFWPAVDQLCRATQHQVRTQYHPRRAGLLLSAGAAGNFPIAYAGPLRAHLTSARRVFNEQLDYEAGQSEITHTFQMNVEVMWEDRFRLVAYRAQPEVVRAVTDNQVVLPAMQQTVSDWNVANAATRQISASLRLQPAPAAARRLRELTLRWGLIAVGGMETLDLTDLTPEKTHRQEDLSVTLETFEERAGERFVVSLLIARDLVVPQPQEVLLHENDVEMLDATGAVFSVSSRTQTLIDTGARLRFTFDPPDEAVAPYKLRVHYPRLRAQRDMEITFRDVPLPSILPQ